MLEVPSIQRKGELVDGACHAIASDPDPPVSLNSNSLTKITHNMYGSQHPVFLKAFDQLAQLMKQAGLEDQLSALQLQLLMGGQANVSVGGSATGAPPSATAPAK